MSSGAVGSPPALPKAGSCSSLTHAGAPQANIDSWLTIEEVTPHTCRQILEGTIEINIFGLGALAERIVVDNLKTVYKGIPKIVERCCLLTALPCAQ